MAKRKPTVKVVEARREVQLLIKEFRQQAELESNLYTVQDLKRLADDLERVVFGDGYH